MTRKCQNMKEYRLYNVVIYTVMTLTVHLLVITIIVKDAQYLY